MTFIAPVERPRIDAGRIEALCEEIGPYATEDLVCRAMEDIALGLKQVHDGAARGTTAELRASLDALALTAEQIGLTTMARIARDVAQCIDDGDPVAEAATLARLVRSGERSLAALWDLQGVSI